MCNKSNSYPDKNWIRVTHPNLIRENHKQIQSSLQQLHVFYGKIQHIKQNKFLKTLRRQTWCMIWSSVSRNLIHYFKFYHHQKRNIWLCKFVSGIDCFCWCGTTPFRSPKSQHKVNKGSQWGSQFETSCFCYWFLTISICSLISVSSNNL